jgi:hypothetical protein
VADLAQGGGVDVLSGHARGLDFEDPPHVVDLNELLRPEGLDDGPAVGRQANDADGRELAQRFAHGRAADAELGGEFLFDQPVPAVNFAGEDRREDLPDQLPAKGAAGDFF